MLTVTKTIEQPITSADKIALNNQTVCDALIAALESGDKKNACEYAKVMMLKAMSM
jgi:hypothetical protein